MLQPRARRAVLGSMTFQDAAVRRPILAVSDSTKAENLLCFDKDLSVIINRNSPEGRAIRDLISKMKDKIVMQEHNGTYKLDAWGVPPGDGSALAPFQGPGRQ